MYFVEEQTHFQNTLWLWEDTNMKKVLCRMAEPHLGRPQTWEPDGNRLGLGVGIQEDSQAALWCWDVGWLHYGVKS